ncbi:MAG: hypothetical protein ACE5J2_09180 [Nitrososphaerales archaeon]
MRSVTLAVALSIILLASGMGLSKAGAAAANTQITLDSLADFPITQGETLVFTGQLVRSSTLQGISGATVNIVHQITFDEQNILLTGQTDTDGFFSIPWTVDVEKVIPQTGGSFGTEDTQGRENRFQVKVFAQFNGDSEFARSTSNAQSFEVRLNSLKISIEKKTEYFVFEKATIKIKIMDGNNNLVDPDKITVQFDNLAVTMLKEETGVYVFSVSSLAPGSHQLQVNVEKRGHTPDDDLVTIEAMKRRTAVVIDTDRASYQQGETVNITASLIDTSVNQVVTDRVVTGSLAAPNLVVKPLTFVDGKGSYSLATTDVTGTWSISASFRGDNAYFASTGQASFTVTKFVGEIAPPPRPEPVSLSRLTFVDQTGSRLTDVTVGQQIMIQAKVTNNFKTTEEIAYISQVKDSDGITVALSWITGTLAPQQSFELAISWIPETPGDYTAEVFVWKSIKNPEPLSFKPKMSKIIVS